MHIYQIIIIYTIWQRSNILQNLRYMVSIEEINNSQILFSFLISLYQKHMSNPTLMIIVIYTKYIITFIFFKISLYVHTYTSLVDFLIIMGCANVRMSLLYSNMKQVFWSGRKTCVSSAFLPSSSKSLFLIYPIYCVLNN